MESAADGLRITQVADLSGVGVHTLRAWERRYGLPRPGRSQGGQRLYTQADVGMVRRMQELAMAGMALSRAAVVARAEIEPAPKPATTAVHSLDQLRRRLFDALVTFNERDAVMHWTALVSQADIGTVIDDALVPLLEEVGTSWSDGTVGVAEEHFASAFVRSRLEALARQAPQPGSGPRVLLACVAGEQHEGALVMLHVLLRYRGLRTIVLGADTPSAALEYVARSLRPTVVCLHMGSSAVAIEAAPLLTALRDSKTAVLVGGRGAGSAGLPHELPPAGERLNDAASRIAALAHRRHAGASRTELDHAGGTA